jgi:pimeloyl-ACP methyl ester carboxylesterase
VTLLRGTVASFRGHRWAAVRGALAERFTLVLMDRRGRGLSGDGPEEEYALAREAEDVAAVSAELGPETFVLAHSYGGSCALEAAASGARAARLLVYEPAFGTPEGPVFPPAALAAVEVALARGDREAALETFFADVLALHEAAIGPMRGTAEWRARVAAAPTLAREGRAANAFRPRAGALAMPVRFLLGTETTPPLSRAARAAHAAVPGSSLRELPGHGHAAMDTGPELFVAEVVAWLSG